jgi:hypothetical protein
MKEEVLIDVLSAIKSHRLVLFTGAGLSIPAPSSVPTAPSLAHACAERHLLNTQEPLSEEQQTNLEGLAELFLTRGKLETYFLRSLVDWRPFLGEPNPAHFAVADFLLAGVAQLAVSTNFDALVEIAATRLGASTFENSLSGTEAAEHHEHMPLLKLHGCAQRNRNKTLWCRQQLGDAYWEGIIDSSARWLAGNLMERDIVFVGYWTEWDYLIEVLERAIQYGNPRSVTVVDISTEAELQSKAPALWNWAHRENIVFRHLQVSGAEFLDELRRRFSILLLQAIAATGREAFEATRVEDARSVLPVFAQSTSEDLYNLRRDWTGSRRDAPATRRDAAPSDEQLGKLVYQLVAEGATLEGDLLHLKGKRLRVLHASGRLMYAIKRDFEGDMTPSGAPELTICVGAEDDGGVATNIVRGERSTIVRPGVLGEWCSPEQALIRLAS